MVAAAHAEEGQVNGHNGREVCRLARQREEVMTVEERLEKIEQLHAEQLEAAKQDRAAHIAWKRDIESQVQATWKIERAGDRISRMAEENASGFAALRAQTKETDRRLKDLGEATDQRIQALVVAMGRFLSQLGGPRWPEP